ncbi:uncharacterized protein [Dendropsophus ebraccatus]|uniref:uncharacterized protein isoform X2 n=1 Tax=Dendropsophus ebraccatus TaxID=150705 RepID=UPI0038315772
MWSTNLLSLSFLILSVQTVNSLRCGTCADVQCNTTTSVTCPPDASDACVTLTITRGNAKTITKGCISKEECDSQLTIPPGASEINRNCCYNNLCNSAVINKMALSIAGFLVLVSLYVSRY